MEIIITDLTRFSNDEIVCTAGINAETMECIRPMPYLQKSEIERLNIQPGAIIEGNFAPRTVTPPHIEDKSFEGNLAFLGPCSADDFKEILNESKSNSVEEGFSVSLEANQKHIPPDEAPDISIITLSIEPSNLTIVRSPFERQKLKVTFTDTTEHTYRYLSITDLGFFNYARRHAEDDSLDDLNDFIGQQDEIFLRIGLSRVYDAPDGRRGFWIQVNGIYTFPDYLDEIRSYR